MKKAGIETPAFYLWNLWTIDLTDEVSPLLHKIDPLIQ